MSDMIKPLSGRRVFLYFFLFFGMIAAVNAVFISNALRTHSGVVTERAYEKGLAFNETLEAARAQPDIDHRVSYQDGLLRWELPMKSAQVSALMIRPIREGDDFKIELQYKGAGVYEARPDIPIQGAWTAKLKAAWNDKTFQTQYELMAQ